jgi:DNA helicase II / ATP-dependent DNA helicase PcrA
MTGTEAASGGGLNTRQREAVEYSGGPLIVLAGPGTGKTRVIIHRIARMIGDGAEPESIVAVTYTVKAAKQLRERLTELVGGLAADRVNAHTFHGFGYRLVRRFSDYLGLPPTVKLIDSAQTRRLLRSLIREHDLFPELVSQGRDSVLDSCMSVMGHLANHAIFPDKAEEFCRRWAMRLERNSEGLDESEHAAARVEHGRFAQMARLCGLYREACAKRGWLTFDDLILLPIQLLREREAAAVVCRDEYRHWVVDEFQDVNQAQIELLGALCPPGRREGPNLCIVGDDDQSIYEFRGADDQAFARFERLWPRAHTVTLTENYRSQRPVIGVANAIIGRAEHRFAPEKIVERPRETCGEPAAPGAGVECVELDGDYQSGALIAAMILADRAEDETRGSAARGWRDFAVIARSHRDLDRIGSALLMEGVPVRLARGPSALDDRGIRDLLHWIELLAESPTSPTAAFATQWILARPPFSVAPAMLSEWAQAYRAASSRARIAQEEPVAFLGWLQRHHGDDAECGGGVRRLHALEAELRRIATQGTAEEAIFEIIRRTDLAHAELLPGRERGRRVAHLAEVLRFVRDRMDVLDPPADLRAFWGYYQDLSEEERAFRSGNEDPVDGDAEDAEEDRADAVMLLTAHSAKGLEFDTVFVPRCRPGHGYPNTRGGDEDVLPEGLIDRGEDTRGVKERRAAEERRLFYVAATRAERRLVVLADKRKNRSGSVDFFNELTLDDPCRGIVSCVDAAGVLARASELGVRLATHTQLSDIAADLAGEGDLRERVLLQARQEARLHAANALDQIDTAAVTPELLAQVHERLNAAADRLSVAAFVSEFGHAPQWALGRGGPLSAYASRLVEMIARGRDEGDLISTLFKPLKAPLKLSYSWIYEYERCPRCFYLRRVLGFPEPQGVPQVVGTAAHHALAAFYQRVRVAEADGGRRPGLAELLALGRDEFMRSIPARAEADPEQLKQLEAQLRLAFERLISERDEVEQIEHAIRFPYWRGGQEHTFDAKIDRLDRLPSGGHRIVDYKTGKPSAALREPERDDLQLGIYSMALRHHQNGLQPDESDAPPVGLAEYWVLATGERGCIALADMDYVKLKARIDRVIDGLLAGNFERGEPGRGCWGLCEVVVGS